MNRPYYVLGMHGLGDNLHQRAIVRQLLERERVMLETPWPSIYHDLADGHRLRLVRKGSTLRTQAKNVVREHGKYHNGVQPSTARMVRVWYTGEQVRRTGSILAAMMESVKCDYARADFRLPVPQAWTDQLAAVLPATDKPIMVYRPLVERTEWQGCRGRNPDFDAYLALFTAIRERFFVVSVADLVPKVEWTVGHPIEADREFHVGELHFELLAALTKRAALMFCSPGFAPLLAQAVGTPSVCIFGGHESSITIAGGARMTPTLGIDPIKPCDCFDHHHQHDKRIDVPLAIERLRAFVESKCALRS